MTGIVESLGVKVVSSTLAGTILSPILGGDRVRIRKPIVPGEVRQQRILGTEFRALQLDAPTAAGRRPVFRPPPRGSIPSKQPPTSQGGGPQSPGRPQPPPGTPRPPGVPTEGPLARIWEYIVGIAGGTAVYDILRRVLEEFGGETPEEKARREREQRERAMESAEIDIEGYERRIRKARERGRELEREAKEAAAQTQRRIAEADKRMREEIAAAERARRERIERFVKIGTAVLTAGTAVYGASAAKAAPRVSVAGGPAAVPPTPTPPRPTPPPPQLGFATPITGFGAPSAAALGIDVGLATPTALAAGQTVAQCETVKTRSKKKRGRCRAGFFQEFTDSTRYVTWREAPCRTPSEFAIARSWFA